MPEVLIFAGPNGSGKSTLKENLDLSRYLYLNADDIGREMNISALLAGKEFLRRREACLAEKTDFAFETTLSSAGDRKLFDRLRGLGYAIKMHYVVTASVEINLRRIRLREREGLHGVPEETVRRRSARSAAQLPHMLEQTDEALVWDNTGSCFVKIYWKTRNGTAVLPNPLWSEKRIRALTGCFL